MARRRKGLPHRFGRAFIDSHFGKVPCKILHVRDWDNPLGNCRVEVTQHFPPFELGEIVDRPLLMVCPATALFPGPAGGWMIGAYSWPEVLSAHS